MNGPSRQMLKRLTAAVEWRSYGFGWTAIAERLGARPEVCARWPNRYPDLWRRVMSAAEERRFAESQRVAHVALMQLLRDPDPMIRLRAERLVRRYPARVRAAQEAYLSAPSAAAAEELGPT
jgi:hypothetical protein